MHGRVESSSVGWGERSGDRETDREKQREAGRDGVRGRHIQTDRLTDRPRQLDTT